VSYNNLLYLLVVIFLVTSGPDSSGYSAGIFSLVSFWLGKLGCFYLLCRFLFSPSRVHHPASYMKAERLGNVLAIASVGMDVYYFHGLYYLMFVPGFREMPILAHITGVAFFFFYLMFVWFAASTSHNLVFGRQGDSRAFIAENLRANIPIGLPWVVVGCCVDFLKVLPVPWLHEFMVNGSGEFIVFGLFFLFLVLVFPPLLMKIWRCRPLAQGLVRDELTAMCERLQLQYRDILIWPLFGGQVLTAGVVGFIARFRYLLITNGLLTNLTGHEIESVIAHETGHVKYYHMPLYLFVLLGFSLIVAPVLCGINYIVLQTDWAFALMDSFQLSVPEFVEISETVVLFILMILFLRFVFGFFMRNFERQADLHAFSTTGGSRYIASSLEKVAILSGDIRDLPSWHHFGVGQRIDFLLECDHDPGLVKKHHRKVAGMLMAYGLLIVLCVAAYAAIPANYLQGVVVTKVEGALLSEIAGSPENAEAYWALGDFYYSQQDYLQAIQAYNDSLALHEDNAEVHNNLAWLYVTCENPAFLDFPRGLVHAHRAVALFPAPHILDTYAHALWVNDRRDEALLIEQQALKQAQKEKHKIQFRRQIENWKRQVP
jgi:Zn-dependent protease with chaperone function